MGAEENPIADEATTGATIHTIGGLREIPTPNFPFGEVGTKVYEEWCRNLLNVGMLTLKSLDIVENLALAKDQIAKRLKDGKEPTTRHWEVLRAAQMKLEKLNGDTQIKTTQGGESPYARFGFAKRARLRRHGDD